MNKYSSAVTLAGGGGLTIITLFITWGLAGFPKPIPDWFAPTCATIVMALVHLAYNVLKRKDPQLAQDISEVINTAEGTTNPLTVNQQESTQ